MASFHGAQDSHLASGPWKKKSLNFIFPTKYVIPKSLKFSHWPSKDLTWGLGSYKSQSEKVSFFLRVITGWGSNKAFNDTFTLLLETSIDQLMRKGMCMYLLPSFLSKDVQKQTRFQ